MRPISGWIGIILIFLTAGFAWSDSAPTTAPSATLGHGRLAYSAPDGWEPVASATTDTTAAFISADHVGILAIQLLPTDAVVDSSAGPSICRQLKAIHAKAKQRMLLVPTIVKDARFSLCIHERYVDDQGNTDDELHLYRQAGPLGVMLTVNARTDDSETAKKTHAVGEDVMLSAAAVRKK
ncbi:MAG TPA: hypothetical protein VHY37_08645 [Tepidisphaeraceae bacterium]|jgi:hypothetical protein|nr:hypothetical protein [Tepidisphaeraceae bacterium]